MTLKIIPEQRFLICDMCGKTNEKRFGFASNARIVFKRDILDYQGTAVADGTKQLDLCDDCANRVGNFLEKERDV